MKYVHWIGDCLSKRGERVEVGMVYKGWLKGCDDRWTCAVFVGFKTWERCLGPYGPLTGLRMGALMAGMS